MIVSLHKGVCCIFDYCLAGDLLNKAKEKVISDGYQFVKGKSRSKSVSETESESPARKRAKLDAEERSREMKLLEENFRTLTNRMSHAGGKPTV